LAALLGNSSVSTSKTIQNARPLIPFDPEIKATTQRQSGARKRQQQQVIMAKRNPSVLRDYVLSNATSLTSSIINPVIKANNFELQPALVSFV